MSLVLDVLVNLWRLVRNTYVRLLKRPPEYVTVEVSGSLPELETRLGLLQRRADAHFGERRVVYSHRDDIRR